MTTQTTFTDAETASVIDRFNAAFLQHDPSLLDGLIAEDCILENTVPAPDGARCVGREACLAVWTGIAGSRDGKFEPEDITVLGERAIIRWRYRWGDEPAQSVRGVNLMRVKDGLIVEGMGYVKGPGNA